MHVGILIVLVGLGAVAVGAVAATYSARSLAAADRLSSTLIPEAHDANSLLTELVDQETGERGYIITGEKKFLQPYDQGSRDVAVLTGALRDDARSDPTEQRLLTAVESRYAAWLDKTARPEITEVASGHTATAVAAERTGAGKARFDAIRSSVNALMAQIASAQRAAATQMHDRALATLWLSIATTVVAVALLAVSWFFLRRWVTVPIARLDGEVAVVASGDLGHAVRPGGLAEMASLGTSVERMRRRLLEDSDELRHLRQALTQGSLLQEQLRSELEPASTALDLRVSGRVLPADGVLAGDWYDAWQVGSGLVYLALVDVSGHGASSGIFALRMKTLLGVALSSERSPGAALEFVSEQLGDTGERFATAVLVAIDTATGRCSYANAGHPPGIVLHQDSSVTYLEPTGPLLGPFRASWTTRDLTLRPSDTLVLYTDGLIEARRLDGTEMEVGGLLESLPSAVSPQTDPDEVVESLIEIVRSTCLMPLFDDATIFVAQLRRPDHDTHGGRSAS